MICLEKNDATELHLNQRDIEAIELGFTRALIWIRERASAFEVTRDAGLKALNAVNELRRSRMRRNRSVEQPELPTCFKCDEYMTADPSKPGTWNCTKCNYTLMDSTRLN